MATAKPAYRQLGSEENFSAENEDLHYRHPGSRWLSVPTIVLSITTIIFGLQSLYLSTLRRNVCFEQEALAFEEGYPTEWRKGCSPPPS